MSRTTIDFGIDLGTTNSAIAVLNGITPEIVKNDLHFESTPSVVWMDRKNRLHVGYRAQEQLIHEDEYRDVFGEFKRGMGRSGLFTFHRAGVQMSAEELSAEVLKALKADVQQRLGEGIQAAVITVPAAFDRPECEATKRAAQLAGLEVSSLLQEPIAAAMAYGFQKEETKAFWLVFDIGGGTFDAAVIRVRDGLIEVVNHGGDLYLGGKDIDWAIVEHILVPAVVEKLGVSEFDRKHMKERKWEPAFNRLKRAAEQARIELSQKQEAGIRTPDLFKGCPGYDGEDDDFEYDLERSEIEPLIEPVVARSINICKKVLEEKRLRPSDIERVILVGGPTLTPYLRERLAEPRQGLGIPLDFRQDPITVVAAGAAIFAGTQRMDAAVRRPTRAGQYTIQLEYKPVAVDTEPLVGGKVIGREGEDLTGFTVEFVDREARPEWRSGRITLGTDGVFTTNLWAEKGRKHTFLIELCDPSGTRLDAQPGHLPYTPGVAITDPPLTHSIGVAMANNETDFGSSFGLKKGTPLPAQARFIHHQVGGVRKGDDSTFIWIPVVEGESRIANRNRRIGFIEIRGSQVKRDVPAGTEIEITIKIDRSGLLQAMAYVPILDDWLPDFTKDLVKPQPDLEELGVDVEREKKRLAEVSEKVDEIGDPKAQEVLQRIEDESLVDELDSLLDAAQGDEDAAGKCEKRLQDLRQALDEAEGAIEKPAAIADAQEAISATEEIVAEYGNADDKRVFASARSDLEAQIRNGDSEGIRRKTDELRGVGYGVLVQHPGWWLGYLDYLRERRHQMRETALADRLLEQGDRAVQSQDLDMLKAAVRQLIELLPADEQEAGSGYGGTTLR